MAETSRPKSYGGLRVLVAGGGVAGLEALLGLRALAGDLVDLELLAPETLFWYRPLAVAEPFGLGRARHLELGVFTEAAGAALTLGELTSVDARTRVARTSRGAELAYDALLIACGALSRPAVAGALTFRGPADSDAYRRVLADAESGAVGSIVFAVPALEAWGLPLYELALMTAARLRRSRPDVELALVTPESEPLSLFGPEASATIRALLDDGGIALHTGQRPVHVADGRLRVIPGASLPADRVVALPLLEGRRILGLPQDDEGFVATDLHGRVLDMPGLYAAGDITRFPVKQGGIAAQQALAAAETIAASAGAAVEPRPFTPVLRGLLLTGGSPRYLRSGRGSRAAEGLVATEALWWPPGKIVGRHLAPFLAEHGLDDAEYPPLDADAHQRVEIELSAEGSPRLR